MKTFLTTLVTGLLLATTLQAEWPINDICPVDQKAARPIFRSRTAEGPVAFCCADCKEKFDKAPSSFKVTKKPYAAK